MKTEELKIGDILTYRNGNTVIISNQESLDRKKEMYNKNLKHSVFEEYDIMKIERYVPYKETNLLHNKDRCFLIQTVYERPQTIPYTLLTSDEIRIGLATREQIDEAKKILNN